MKIINQASIGNELTVKDLKFMPKFFDRYIDLVPNDINLLDGLKKSSTDFYDCQHLLEKYQDYSYEVGKWTPKDILQHIIDNEKIQTYRALAFSRNDKSIMPGYDQNLYADHSNAKNRTITDLLKEFELVRGSSILFFESLNEEMYHTKGICFEVEVTPLALGFLNIGHAKHHLNVLNEKYFKI
ncbi:DinB family protein [Aquimarina agarilytica]|uniref:DinB family protein n=1 Tax=Aquimarina agarilytica TaxID=1087449 RepID=UPI0002890D1B|nr:DinB family protein [Aquimarina agarilytica]